MSLSRSGRARLAAVFVVGLVTAACSLIVDKDKDQCSSDGDCSPAGRSTCIEGVCVLATGPIGADSASDAPVGDAAKEAEGGGCVPKVPATDLDFLNERCTSAECIPFDNCARLGVCDGGLPALVDPPTGGI